MTLDWIFYILAVLAFIRGYSKGFLYSLFYFISIFVGLFAAGKFSSLLASLLMEHKPELGRWAFLLSFITLTLGVVWLVRFLVRKFQQALKTTLMGMFNKILGGILYLAMITVVFSIVVWFLHSFKIVSEETFQSSNLATYLVTIAEKIFGLFKEMGI